MVIGPNPINWVLSVIITVKEVSLVSVVSCDKNIS